MLHKQGLQMNQPITFLSDGGQTVRDLQLYLTPTSEHILDWFHITVKLTVMNQMAKGMKNESQHGSLENLEITKKLDSTKWNIWHGNVYKGLKVLDSLREDLEITFCDNKDSKGYKLWKAADEFYEYIEANSQFIPNYSNRYLNGDIITTSFVESTVNELISRRMAKKQQMRWTKKGAHLLLQLQVKTLNNEFRSSFCKLYPRMDKYDGDDFQVAA